MPIDTNIALGVKPIQVENPLAQYSQVAQIQNARNQNALSQLQMREAEATAQERNALRQLDPTSQDYEAQLFRLNPQLGIAYRKEKAAAEASGAAATASKTTAAKNKQAMLGQAYRDISSRPSDANITAHLEDILTSSLYDDEEKTNIQVRATKLLAMPFEERKMFLAQQGASAGELKPSTQTINRSGQTDVLSVPAFGGTPKTVGTYADVPLPPAVLAQKKEIAKSSAANVTYGPQEKAEKVEYGKFLVDQFKGVNENARIAARSMPAIESNLAILDKGFDTGFGTETIAAGAKVLGALGVQNAKEFATDAQTFLASANAAVLQKQLEQKGPQTEPDAQRITATGAQLGNTKEANKFLLNVAKAQLERDLKQREFYAAWREKNKTLEGAEDAWYAGPGSKSLFDNPALKRYGPSVVDQIPGQSRSAPASNSVTLPDGRVKTFPNAAAANQFKKAAGL
jgi:hypothetical protein